MTSLGGMVKRRPAVILILRAGIEPALLIIRESEIVRLTSVDVCSGPAPPPCLEAPGRA